VRNEDPSYEVERRFLVDDPSVVQGHPGNLIVQAYLFSVDGYVVRVRRTHWPEDSAGHREGPAIVAVKGPRVAARRLEYEMQIPTTLAAELIKRAPAKVSKTRYHLIANDTTWDVDLFHGDNDGLIIAECETPRAASIVPPPWCHTEITDESRYNNESLATTPYLTW
jgi:CYTH domain-containing protein